MNNEKISYTPSEIAHGCKNLKSIHSTALESSDVENLSHTNISSKENSKNKNNSNISRTSLDTQLIDLNADGDSDESKYNDEI